jgi:DNA-binding IclR family transcriptional regulator
MVYIDKVEPQRAIRIWSEIGWRNPALTTALGRAIMSQKFIDYESFAASYPNAVPKRTPHTKNTLRAVWQELGDTRRRGFSKEEQENELGITCMGMAILRGANAVAAISVTAPFERMDMKRMTMLAKKLRESIEPGLPPGLSLQKPAAPLPKLARKVAAMR